jgi:hypothetical protein
VTNNTWHRAMVLFLGLAFALVSGCANDSTLVDPTKATLGIQVIPRDIAAPWVLVGPDGVNRTGNGNANLPMMPLGTYRITWGTVEGWVAPSPNVVSGIHESSSYLIFTAIYTKADVTQGTIVIDPNPDTLDVSWTLTGPNGYSFSGFGDATLEGLTAGPYVLTWREILGYVTPDAESAILAEGETVTFTQTYFLRDLPTGDLSVQVVPSGLAAPWRIEGGSDFRATGTGDSTFVDVPIGQYTITWEPIEGWTSPTPNPASVSVSVDASATVSGAYTAITVDTGTIRIDPTPDALDVPWTLEGPDRFVATGNGDREFTGRAVGTYRITWGSVADHDAPAPSEAVLASGAVLEFSGTYVLHTGSLTIDPEPWDVDAPWTLSGSFGAVTGRGNRTYDTLGIGVYTLTWGPVSGWNMPDPQTRVVSVSRGEHVVISGTYQEIPPETGTVIVEPRPLGLNAPWSLTGPNGFSRAGSGTATFTDLDIGTYEVAWQAVANWNSPSPTQESRTLTSGATLRFTGTYTDPNGPGVTSATGSAVHGGTLRLSGTSFGRHTLEVEWTGDWIESQPDGTNPSAKSGWSHAYSSNGIRDHVTSTRAWSGRKSIDTSVDQTKLPYTPSSTLSYLRAPFERMYATWWTYIQPHAHASGGLGWTGMKYVYITTDNSAGGLILQAPTNSVMNVFSYRKSDNGLTTFQFENNTWIGCSGYSSPYTETFNWATGVGYTIQSEPYWKVQISGGLSNWSNVDLYAPPAGQWVRCEWYADRGTADQPDGELMWSLVKPGSGRAVGHHTRQVVLNTARTDCRSEPDPWQRFVFMQFYDDPSIGDRVEKCEIILDDVYLQFGTMARVELGDRAVYEQCTKLEVQVPEAWTETDLTIQVNHGGAFGSGETAHLFVVREDGKVSPGFPIGLR